MDSIKENLNKFKTFLNFNYNQLSNNNYLFFDVIIDNQIKPRIFKVSKDQEKVVFNINEKFLLKKHLSIDELYLPVIAKIKKTQNALFSRGEKKNFSTLRGKTVIVGCSNDPCDLLIPDYLYIHTKGYFETLKEVDNSLLEIKSNLSFYVGKMHGPSSRQNLLNFAKKN